MSLKNHFEKNYLNNKGSGKGSVGLVRKYVHKIMQTYLLDYELYSFIDFGCGDLALWYKNPPKLYTGLDFAENIQIINRRNHLNKFITQDLTVPLKINADVVVCYNVLYHIIDEEEFLKILNNLCLSSNSYIFIYTWWLEPKKYDKSFQHFRELKKYFYVFSANGFKFDKVFWDSAIDSYGAFYTFRKKGSEK
jgi:2-polyprenyl-3-methyl-5-hydroxy-6-metoxy-1,4-benzoquinol methylase